VAVLLGEGDAAAVGFAGEGEVVAGAAAGAAVVAAGLACGSAGAATALTARWQDGERLDIFFCRHCNDAIPPGGTLAQCAS